MYVNYDTDLRENLPFYEMGDAVRQRAACVSRECPIHVDAIFQRSAMMSAASRLAELRYQDDAPSHVAGL
jgi:hypothetical protein